MIICLLVCGLSTVLQSLGCVLYCMMMLEGPYDLVFQKGDSVALAVQNPVTIPPSCRSVFKLLLLQYLYTNNKKHKALVSFCHANENLDKHL